MSAVSLSTSKSENPNTKPHISVNLLGEFLTTNAKRQRRILEQLKYPDDNRFAFGHNYAREAAKRYLIKGFDENIVLKCIKKYQGMEPTSPSNEGVINSSIEGLNIILNGNADLNSSFDYQKYEGDNPKIDIKGVEVSVKPDLVIRSISRKKKYVGAFKFHMSKNSPVKPEGGKYIATILYYFTEQFIKNPDESVKHNHCLSFDVPTDSLVECPKGVKNRWDEIEAGCMNIAAMWDGI